MLSEVINILMDADALFWGYIGFTLIMVLGCFFTIKTRFFQLRTFPQTVGIFFGEIFRKSGGDRGIHPIRAFFASVGGMLGVGNIVGIVTAIQLGGPGALFWVWVAGFAGTLIKYSEIYLGLKYRVKNDQQGYDGGPMFFLKKAFGVNWVSSVVCVLLCIYGAEVYQFNVVVDTVAFSTGFDRIAIAVCLLGLIFYAAIGGVKRVATICGWVMPFFIFVYIGMAFWIIGSHFSDLPGVLAMVFKSAFTGQAAVGGFAGSTVMLAIQNGMAGACYAADIGIGYDSTIQSESNVVQPERQARMAIFGVCLDNFICSLSILLVLVTGLWQMPISSGSAPLVQIALSQHFPMMDIIMPFFIFILGYTTLIAYLIVGIKCSRHLHVKKGPAIYIGYSLGVMSFFAFFDQTLALLVMRIAGALLLIINLSGIWCLRHEIFFEETKVPQAANNEEGELLES